MNDLITKILGRITIHRTIRWFFIFGHLSPLLPAATQGGRGTDQRPHLLLATLWKGLRQSRSTAARQPDLPWADFECIPLSSSRFSQPCRRSTPGTRILGSGIWISRSPTFGRSSKTICPWGIPLSRKPRIWAGSKSACARGRGRPRPRGWRSPSIRTASGESGRSPASWGRRIPSSGTSARKLRGTYSSSWCALNLGCRYSTFGSFQCLRWSARQL